MTVLITGGAGYIGSVVNHYFADAGEETIVVDDLSTGFREAVKRGKFVEGNCGDFPFILDVLKKYKIDTVVHMAAKTSVPESVSYPLDYYQTNTVNTLNLLKACVEAGVKYFIFSSTAAVYGIVNETPVKEDHACNPISPYGASKLASEMMIRDVGFAHQLNYINLRYFNVAGANVKNDLGPRNSETELIIRVAAQAAAGKRKKVAIFGDDYATIDGTAVRDFIHVNDIASAHLSALNYLREGGESQTLNCGYGHGYSVKQIFDAMQCITGKTFLIEKAARREGDAAGVVADNGLLKGTLKWQPLHDNLDEILLSAYEWERR